MNVTQEEFFNTLQNIREELLSFKVQQNQLQYQISSIFEENKKLTEELKENVQIRYLQFSESGVGQLEQKLQAAIESKNAAVEMWQSALQQLEKQEEMLLGKKSIVESERSEIVKQFEQIKEEYTKGLNILSEELSNSRNEISNLKKDLKEINAEFQTCKNKMETANEELETSKKIINNLSSTNHCLEEKINSLQILLSDSNKENTSLKEKLHSSNVKISELSELVTKLEEQNKRLKHEAEAFEKDAKESLLTAKEAILKKKETIYKEEQYQKEIESLKSSIDLEIQKVILKHKAEIKDIKKQASENIQSLKSEIEYLHKEISEKQTLFEKANREKQALESKVDMLFSESSNGGPFSNVAFEDICKRLTMAERARDEFELKVASLETSLSEIKAAKEQEIQYLLEQQNNLKERNLKLSRDFTQASTDKIRLADEITKCRRKCYELEKDLKHIKTKYSKEINMLEEKAQEKQAAIQEQQRITEEHYKNVCNELQKLLDAEFKISNKWKLEVEALILQSEAKIMELCKDVAQVKSHNTELIAILHENNIHIPSASKYLINYHDN